MTTIGVEKLLARLDRVKQTGDGRFIACCPAHDDRSPSLAIRETADGTLLVHCFAGCPTADVLAAIGLELSDLFPSSIEYHAPILPRQRYVPRDVLECIALEALVAYLAVTAIQRGDSLTLEDMERLAEASRRLRSAAAEVGCHV